MAIFRYNLILCLLIFAISCSENQNHEQDIAFQSDSSNTKSNKITADDKDTLVKIEIPVDDLVPAEFSEEDLASIRSSGKAPFVINLRKALNDYAKGKTVSPYFEKSAIIAVGDNLATFNKDYYKSKFFILQINTDYPVGGVFMDILFRDKPDKIFTVWMFETENMFKLRMFEQNLDFSISDIKGTLKMFENVFNKEGVAF